MVGASGYLSSTHLSQHHLGYQRQWWWHHDAHVDAGCAPKSSNIRAGWWVLDGRLRLVILRLLHAPSNDAQIREGRTTADHYP